MIYSSKKIGFNIANSPDVFVAGEHLSKYGENCCKEYSAVYGRYTDTKYVYKRAVNDIRECLRAVHAVEKFTEVSGMYNKNILPEEFSWLIDNAYLIKEEKTGLSSEVRGHKRLPRSVTSRKLPCVYLLAEGFLRSGYNSLSEERLRVYLSGVQQERTLNENELWLFGGMLRCAVLRALNIIAQEIVEEVSEYSREGSVFFAERRAYELLCTQKEPSDEIKEKADAAKALHAKLTEYIKNAFNALRSLRETDYSDVLSEMSGLDRLLQEDPTQSYNNSDRATKAGYRIKTERIAKRSGRSESETAKALIYQCRIETDDLKRSVCWQIDNDPYITGPKKRRAGLVFVADTILPVIICLLLGIVSGQVWVFFAAFLPVWEFTKSILHHIVLSHVTCDPVARMDLSAGVPQEGSTIVAVSVLLVSKEQADSSLGALERYYLSNRECGDCVIYGIVADMKDCASQDDEADEEILRALMQGCDRLNQKYGERFCFFSRKRSYYKRENIYFGKERKRGALAALAALICGDPSELCVYGTNKDRLHDMRYILALDSDTVPTPDSIRYMIGCALHPVNKAVLNSEIGRVTSGYGVFQMRISTDLEEAGASEFARIYAGQGGTDSYSGYSADMYQDIFGEAIFTGKGLIDVRVMHSCLNDAIPEGRILSHDLLEGSYLRTAFVSQAEMTDGFPAKVLSFFKRYARWVRGDVQLIPWLFKNIRNRTGEVVKNPLNRLSKYKIFDNLRRVLTPVAQLVFLAVFIMIQTPATSVVSLASFVSIATPLFINCLVRLRSVGHRLVTKGHATIYAGIRGGLILTVSKFLFLPYEAYISLRSAVTALYRMYISKKNLLEWVTAAESEKTSVSGVWAYYRKMLICPVVGAAVLVLGMNPVAFIVATFWLFAPLFAAGISTKTCYMDPLTDKDKRYLRETAENIWNYFADQCIEENNYLPPDNYQEQPLGVSAELTSPTNIGFALMSAVAADSLEIANGLVIIQNIINTLANMDKKEGMFYNWYNIKTLQPLYPYYVSSVDCGNLAGALIIVSEYLSMKYPEQGSNTQKAAEKLYSDMDFGKLYDRKRNLFRITDSDGSGHYDMLASEARLLSYIAIAKRDVPRKHWGFLSRQMSKKSGYSGLVSWGGSLFEFLMPELYMPTYKNSLLGESGRFAVHCQRLRSLPWGISESGYYAFDRDLKYQYKGHGVAAIGVKNGLEKELVISPYSSYLALSSEPQKAMANIYKMDSMFPKGRYGLYEAYDFTAIRIPEAESYMPVRSFMAHHMGMSLCAITNILSADQSGMGILKQMFFAREEMAAYRSLLTERIPIQQRVMTFSKRAKMPERRHIQYTITVQQSQDVHFANLSANKTYSLTTGENGYNESVFGDISLYRAEVGDYENLPGVILLLKDKDGIFSPCSSMAQAETATTEFTERYTRYSVQRRGCEFRYFVAAAQSDSAELRELVVENNGKSSEEFTLCMYFEPILTDRRTFDSHPDYNRMLIYTERTDDGVCVFRRDRNGGNKTVLCFATDGQDPHITTAREVFGRVSYDDAERMFISENTGVFGEVRDCCVRCLISFTVAPGDKKRIRFSIAVGFDKSQVKFSAERTLLINSRKTGRLLTDTAEQMGLDVAAVKAALAVLPHMIYPSSIRYEGFAPSKELLWSVKVSGDNPLLVVQADKGIENVFKAVAIFRMLRGCGRKLEMIILTNDLGKYERKQYAASRAALHFAGRQFSQEIIIADCSEIDRKTLDAIYTAAVFVIPYRPAELSLPVKIPFRGGSSTLPSVMHSQPLANKRFGVMSADCGLMHLWCDNSRLNRLTPWENDPLAGYTKGIRLMYRTGNTSISLFLANDGYDADASFEPGITIWKKRIDGVLFTTKAAVDADEALLGVEITADGETDGEVELYIKPVIGEYVDENKNVIMRFENGRLIAENPSNTSFFANAIALSSNPAIRKYTCNTQTYMQGRFDGSVLGGEEPCLAVAVPMTKEGVYFSVRAGNSLRMPVKESAEPCTEYDSLKIKTPWPEIDAYMNRFSARQIKVSRLFARTSVYQNGGAYGFRDQLQDTTALLHTEPGILREHIIRAAGHQYVQGDVQHWWHPGLKTVSESSLGVRTWCSDDLLWLVWAVCEYVCATGDRSILDEKAPFLISEPLKEYSEERYEQAKLSSDEASIAEHCARALKCFRQRGLGVHGLPLILSGDWNDGMNRMGEMGRGESVWLAHFAGIVFRRFGELTQNKDHIIYADELRKGASAAFVDGQYLRGYDDRGDPVGAEGNSECSIDSISQSFAVFDNADDKKNILAVKKALRLLVDRKNKLVRLFAPPFSSEHGSSVGYISAYPGGVRENGGQYTHAAVWLALACFKCGLTESGIEIARMLLPANHDPEKYRGEPFILAADVYSEGELAGRCGWSWYTGAAGWYRRMVLEGMLGISFENGSIKVDPAITDDFYCEFNRLDKKYKIRQENGKVTVEILDVA